jgi:tRNA modification GTPase
LLGLVKKHLNDGRRGEIIRSGFQIAIIGPPNAGKSSLLNWFGTFELSHCNTENQAETPQRAAQRDAAIVTAKPGTTRDIVEVSLDFHGFAVTIADTAGIRETEDEVEAIGVQRAKQRCALPQLSLNLGPTQTSYRALEADLKVLVLDASDPVLEDQELLDSVDVNTIVVLNKSDLQEGVQTESPVAGKLLSSDRAWVGRDSEAPFRHMSVKDGTGLDDFTESLKELLGER